MQKLRLFILLFILNTSLSYSQGSFVIENDRRRDRINFSLVNNLIIIPVELNGVELSFLLDTGVDTTVLLNLEEADSLQLKNARKIRLRGLGGEELIEAYRSDRNRLRIGKAVNDSLTLYLIYDEAVNFSPRLGIPVHGIIGYDLFKDFVVEINYTRKFIRLHDPERFRKNLRRYNSIGLRFFQNKPYINSRIVIEEKPVDVILLVDNGLGDAIWLFNENDDIKVPERNFEDFLGLGLLGDVTGKRSRIQSMSLGDYTLEEVTAAFPDSASVQGLRLFDDRNGSIGAEVLRRFNAFFDYGEQQVHLRKNRNFNDPFNYDMSGIILEHSGFVVVETYEKVLDDSRQKGKEVYRQNPQYYKTFELKPAFQVVQVRKNSPAEEAGIQVGDVILTVNGRNAFRYNLEELSSLLSSGEGKRINLEVDRDGKKLTFSFELRELL